MEKKHVVIIGLGGVGGYFGFKISQQNEVNHKNKISFVARGVTYETVKKSGLQLLSPEHPKAITRPNAIYQKISEIQNPDLVLICVKEYDLEDICRQLSKVITTNTVLLPMMNGADIYDRIRKILPESIILPSCVYVASHIREKGIVEHKGKPGQLIVGKDPQLPAIKIDWIIDILEKSKINFQFKESAQVDIWTKFIFIASFGLVTAKYNSSIGAICKVELQKEEATNIMLEIKLIADQKGINLSEDIIRNTFDKAASFPPSTPTSLQLDVHSEKANNELDLFAGAILKYGKETKVPTPFSEKIYLEVKAEILKSSNKEFSL